MKQILQNLKNGETILANVPCPRFHSGSNLIQTYLSLISVGTERMLVDFGKGGLLAKARQQPDYINKLPVISRQFAVAEMKNGVFSYQLTACSHRYKVCLERDKTTMNWLRFAVSPVTFPGASGNLESAKAITPC